MTSFKYLVAFCGMLVVGWGVGLGASTADTDNTAEVTGTPSTETPKPHHRKHHKTATTDAGATTNAATASTTGTGTNKSTEKSSTARTSSATNTTSETASTTTGKSHKKKKHGASTASTTTGEKPAETASESEKTTATNTAKSSEPEQTNAPSATAASGTAAATPASVATTPKTTHRHHHGRPPEPVIVVTPANVPPMQPQAPPAPALPQPSAPVQAAVTPITTTPLSGATPPSSDVPKIETGLPVARPGAGTTATLPIAMVRNPIDTAPLPKFDFTDFAPTRKRTQSYPWKVGIVTTVFWIGESSTPLSGATNHASAWDIDWEHHNGGADDQYDMSGYGSGSHASLINPFYVALPFNDLAYPDKTARWLPSGWEKSQRRGDKPVSACQHRWVEIKNRRGVVCFAQWEDVGPIDTDDAEYVFGPARPAASRGLDVSPAVAKYLGIDSTAVTSWRFVDDGDVLPGLWLRYDEQAILFQALKEQSRRNGGSRIQDLSEPVPDGSEDDANQRKAGASRG